MSQPLVLLHGWGLSARVWSPLQEALSKASLHSQALDLPGHGECQMSASADLTQWTDRIATKLPASAVVCGWSLGGLIALDLAVRYPERVAKLVLIGSTPCFVSRDDWPHGLAPDVVSNFNQDFGRDPGDTQRRFLALQSLGDMQRRKMMGVLATALTSPLPVRQPALAAGLQILADTDLRPVLPQVKCPVRLLHGANDALMPLAAGEWLADHLPNGRLSFLEDCGHAPFISRAEDCAGLIEAFLHE